MVADDGSTDETAEVCAWASAFLTLRHLPAPWGGQAVALNRGIAAAAGRYCLLLDDDIEVEPQFVAAHVRAQDQCGGGIGIGQLSLRTVADLDWFARRHATAWLSRYRALNEGTRIPSWRDCSSGNLSAPRDALLAAGGFAPELRRSFDGELAYRLASRGLRYVYVPRALGHQHYGKRFADVTRDAERAGVAALALYRRHPGMLPLLEIGGRGDVGEVVQTARRALLALHVGPGTLGALGPALPAHVQDWWYRVVFAHAYWAGVRSAATGCEWRSLNDGVRILMYHAVTADRASTRDVIPAARFARQMRWLERRGYRVLSLAELAEHRRAHRLPPPRSVAITFDDGFADFAELALPVLRRHRFPASVFLVTSAVGARMEWDAASELHGRPLLSWRDVGQLDESDVRMGSHTRTHARLTGLPAAALHAELAGSRDDLDRMVPNPLHALTYPYGSYDEAARSAAEGAGYELALGVRPGLNRPSTTSSELRRISVRGNERLPRFALHLWLGTRPALPRGIRERGARAMSRRGAGAPAA